MLYDPDIRATLRTARPHASPEWIEQMARQYDSAVSGDWNDDEDEGVTNIYRSA